MVLALDLAHARALYQEDRHATPVLPPHLDVAQLAATHEAEGTQEQVVGLKHPHLPQVEDPASLLGRGLHPGR